MCINLRKVIFSLGTYEFIPNATEKEKQEMDERCKERYGYFHRWTEEVDCSKEIPCIKAMSMVEEAESGKLHIIESHNLKFTPNWQ